MRSRIQYLLRAAPCVLIGSLAMQLGSCGDLRSKEQIAAEKAAEEGRALVVTTTTMVTDLVQEIGGDKVWTLPLMGPGVDPHLYKSKASDAWKLEQAEAIIYNGLMLEGRLTDIFQKMGKGGSKVYAIAGSLPADNLLKPADFEGHYDPHVWGDVLLWSGCVDHVVKALSETAPEHTDHYKARGEAYKKKLLELHNWAKSRAEEIPEERRVVVSSHDAFEYFGRAYGIKVLGVQGISTATEAGLADMAKTVAFVKENGIKAVFGETSVNDQVIQRIAEDAGVKVGGHLFSDAMGTPGDMGSTGGEIYDKGTYIGMIKHNMNTVVEALK